MDGCIYWAYVTLFKSSNNLRDSMLDMCRGFDIEVRSRATLLCAVVTVRELLSVCAVCHAKQKGVTVNVVTPTL